MPDLRAIIGLPPDETFRAFDQRRTLRATVRWDEMWHADHARAFTVAKIAKLDLLADIQASLADVIANGGTFEQWQANIVPTLRKAGWWGEVQDRDLTGADELVRVGPRRLRTIYDTNLRVSRAAGRWARIQELKTERPFLRYVAVLDSRTRPEHRAWHGVILPVDHPWWDTHFPPCGWHCRCTVRQLSQADLDRKGWRVTTAPPTGPSRAFTRSTGETVDVPAGIAPGFGYNPGAASTAAIADKLTRSLEAAAAIDTAAVRATLDEVLASDFLPQALADAAAPHPAGVLAEETADALGTTARVPVASTVLTPGAVRAASAVAANPDIAGTVGAERFLVGRHGEHGVAVHLTPGEGDRLTVAGVVTVTPAERDTLAGRLDPAPARIASSLAALATAGEARAAELGALAVRQLDALAATDLPAARAAIAGFATGEAFPAALARANALLPAGALDPATSAQLGAPRQVIALPGDVAGAAAAAGADAQQLAALIAAPSYTGDATSRWLAGPADTDGRRLLLRLRLHPRFNFLALAAVEWANAETIGVLLAALGIEP